jgi:putative endopeptidase
MMMGMRFRAALMAPFAGIALAGALEADDPQGVKLNAWGYDISAIDQAAAPGDGFDQYANGAWTDRVTIPSDKASWTIGSIGVDQTLAQVRAILEQAAAPGAARPTDTMGKTGAFYASYLDEARIEALGARPMADDLAAVKNAATRDDLAELMGHNNDGFQGSIISTGVFADLKDPSRNSAYIGQPILGMPDRDYYLKPEFASKKAAYRAYAARLLALAGWHDPDGAAKAIVAYETRMATASWTKVEQRDVRKLYNPRSIVDLDAQASGFAWDRFLKAVGFPDSVVVGEVTALPKIAAIYAKTPIGTLKAWAAFALVDNAADFLSTSFADAHFAFHSRTLAGIEQQQPRWKRAVHQVSGGDFLYGQRSELFGTMGWAVGEAYVARYFPPSSKAAVEKLVDNLRIASRARIEAATWMAPETRAEALRKFAALRVKIGYPDHSRRDYASLIIDRGDLYGNVRRAAALDWKAQRSGVGKPVDHDEWAMTPQTLDAYNGGPTNEIAFPAAILQPPYFQPNGDLAINYGGIGSVIGHEITHSFDDQGRLFDASGAMRDWWTKADGATFTARANLLGRQYSHYEPVTGAHINGDLTMGENIADLGGLAIALDAYRAVLGGKPAPVIDGYTGEQRFFLGYAQGWRGKSRDEALRQQIATDLHAPRRYRIDGVVRNVDAWYAAFGVKPGEKLYLAPDRRVRIW